MTLAFMPGLFDDLLLREPERCHQMAREDAAGVSPEWRIWRCNGALVLSEVEAIADSMEQMAMFSVKVVDVPDKEEIETEA